MPGLTGYGTAAPILFEGFAKSGIATTPLPRPPAGAVRIAQSELPISQRRFALNASGLLASGREAAPQIIYPPEGAHVDLGAGQGNLSPLMLKLQGGRAPSAGLPTASRCPTSPAGASSNGCLMAAATRN